MEVFLSKYQSVPFGNRKADVKSKGACDLAGNIHQ